MNINNDLVRRALQANALFSTLTGLLLAISPAAVGDWLGVNIDGWLRLLGVALLGHAVALAVAATRSDLRLWGRVNLALIAPYPVILVAVLLTGLVSTGIGRTLLLVDAGVVGALALVHRDGLRAVAPSAA